MPIVYETPAPVAAAAGVYQALEARNARDRRFAAAGGGGGGGGGRGYSYGSVPYDTGIQDAIQFRDSLQFGQQRQAQDTQAGYDRQRMAIEGEMAQDRQRFQLQAELHGVELSQQERMRLQRLKNSVGEVSSDPTLSDQEKADFISQIKYNIDPLQRRLAQEKLSQEKIVKESMAEQRQAQAAFEKQRLDIMAKTVADRVQFIPDSTQLAAVVEDFTKNVGPPLTAMFGADVAKRMIGEMAQQEALKQGLGTHAYLQPDGKLMPMKGENPDGSPSSGSRGKAASDHPSGLTQQDYLKAVEQATAQATREAGMTTTDELGVKKPVRPDLQDVNNLNKRVGDILADVYGLPRNFNEFNAGRAAQTPKGYQSRFKPPEAAKPVAAAASNNDPKPFEWSKPETPEQKIQVQNFNGLFDKIRALPSGPERDTAASALSEAQSMLMKGKIKEPADRQKFEELIRTASGVVKSGVEQETKRTVASNPPQQSTIGAWWESRRTAYDENNAPLVGEPGKPLTPAAAVGNLAKRGYQFVYDQAPRLPKFLRGD